MAVVGFHIPGFIPMKTTTANLDEAIKYFSLADMTQLKAVCIRNEIKYPAMDISRTALLVILCNAFDGIIGVEALKGSMPRIPGKKQAAKIVSDAKRMAE